MSIVIDAARSEVRSGMAVLGRLTPVQQQAFLALLAAKGRVVGYRDFAVAMGWPAEMADRRPFKQNVALRIAEIRGIIGADAIETLAGGYALRAEVERCAACGRIL